MELFQADSIFASIITFSEFENSQAFENTSKSVTKKAGRSPVQVHDKLFKTIKILSLHYYYIILTSSYNTSIKAVFVFI